MKLIELAKDIWTVLVYANEFDDCQVLDFLDENVNNADAKKMLSLLTQIVPHSGPPKNDRFSKKIDGSTFEFKKGPKKGKKLRIFYFYDDNKVVVCTCAFLKDDDTPQRYILFNEKIREEYLLHRQSNKLIIKSIKELDDSNPE